LIFPFFSFDFFFLFVIIIPSVNKCALDPPSRLFPSVEMEQRREEREEERKKEED